MSWPARRTSQLERALPSIAQLIASWPGTPAFVQNRHMGVLAANALASALSPLDLALQCAPRGTHPRDPAGDTQPPGT
jgi:MmyB-like transcription regulator ligand binding domain